MEYFKDIIGQEQALEMLTQALQSGNISHAYLFIGPEGVGKYTTALAFARHLLEQGDPSADRFFQQGMHPDLLLLGKEEKKNLIGIEQIIKDLEPWLAFKPCRATKRVAIIKDAHLLSLPAANALLKTLEEPASHAVIILVAEDKNMLDTIVSRCQIIRFFPIREALIKEFLLKQGLTEERTDYLMGLSQGSLSTALALAKEEGFESYWNLAKQLVKGLAQGDEIQVFKAAELMEEKRDVIAGLMEIILRDIYVYQQSHREEFLLIPDDLDLVKSIKKLSTQRITNTMLYIDDLRKGYGNSASTLLLSINISYAIRDALQ